MTTRTAAYGEKIQRIRTSGSLAHGERSAASPAFSLLGVGCLLAALPATGASPQPSLALLAYAAVGILALFPVTPRGLGSPLLPAAPGTRGP
jgi:uncharacterized membrane protein YbhN (UPF0104 family)